MLTYSDPLALKQLEGLYIGRTYHVWKEPEVRDNDKNCLNVFVKK